MKRALTELAAFFANLAVAAVLAFLIFIFIMSAAVLAFLIFIFIMSATAHARTVQGSCYGGGEKLNKHTATGEVFRPGDLTAAHRTLPFGTRVHVFNPATSKAVTVRINDRGPAAWTGREIDLSCGAARRIGFRVGRLDIRRVQ